MNQKEFDVQEIQAQLYDFAAAMATVVDERTPYNGHHTREVVEYTRLMVNYLNELHEMGRYEEYFDENRQEQLILAAYLHDIGKMIMPLSIMNKATRLGLRYDKIKERFTLLKAYFEIDCLKGRTGKKEFGEKSKELDKIWARIQVINKKDDLDGQDLIDVENMSKLYYEHADGKIIPYLNAYEIDCLKIPRGTLTNEERKLMEEHVTMTEKILSKMSFSSRYQNVTKWAITHHECLDGSGYPHHLKGDQLQTESRILAIADVYDALVCADRPYKKASTKEEAFAIMRDMADYGKLDGKLIDCFEEALERKGRKR